MPAFDRTQAAPCLSTAEGGSPARCRGGWVAPLGALPQRTRLGHGAGRLFAGRRRLDLLPPRPRPLARLPLERGRHRGLLGRPAALVPGPGAVERPRPDPEGADVRPDQRRRQPRRGRQGALVLRRRPADPRLHEDGLQVSAGALPLRRPRRRERPAQADRRHRLRIRAVRHGRVRREPLLRRHHRLCQAFARRHPHAGDDRQPRARGRRPPRAAASVGAQRVVLGGEPRGSRAWRCRPTAPCWPGACTNRDRRFSAIGSVAWLFCENETNRRRLYGEDVAGYFKDGINDPRGRPAITAR